MQQDDVERQESDKPPPPHVSARWGRLVRHRSDDTISPEHRLGACVTGVKLEINQETENYKDTKKFLRLHHHVVAVFAFVVGSVGISPAPQMAL